MPRALTLATLTLLAGACVVPRSAGFGQTALPMPAGGLEVGVSPGIAFQASNGPPIPAGGGASNVATTRNLGGTGEANVLVGLTDTLGLNLHVSPAGVQPGAKLSFPSARFSVALLPEIGVAYWSRGSSNQHNQASNMTESDTGGSGSFEMMLGAKVIASHSSGFYGGAGYDYQQISTQLTGPGANSQGSLNVAHAFSLAMGWELGGGAVKIRPELALMILPVVGGWTTSGSNARWAGSGSEFLLFPNVTIALQTVRPGELAGGEGLKPEELTLPPVFPAP